MHSPAIALLGLLFLSPGLRAQPVGTPQTPDLQSAADSVGLQALDQPDAWIGGGPDYRVRFGSEGVRFTPALGSGAEREESLNFVFLGLERGGRPVAEVHGAEPTAHGRRVLYPRGAGVWERWDLVREGVELSYSVPERPAGHGDLVARLAVQSTLGAPGPRAEGGLTFLNARGQGVFVDEVFGVDNNGLRVAGELRFVDGVLELVLPHDFVESAAYPLVIDPLVGGVVGVATSTTFDETRPDLAYDASTDSYLVVWERSFSGTSSDIRGQRVNSLGAPIGGTIFFGSSGRGKRPQVANLNTPDHWVVVWQEAEQLLLGGTRWSIELATVRATTGAIAHTAEVTSSTAGVQEDPDVGGTGPKEVGQPSDAVIVWRDDDLGRIRSRRYSVTATGTLDMGSSFTVFSDSVIGLQIYARPRISKTCGVYGRYLVVCERRSALLNPDIVGRIVRRTGAVEGSTISIANNSGPETAADVDGLDTRFVVVWDREGSGSHLIEARTVDYSLATLAATLTPVQLIAASLDEPRPAIGFGLAKSYIAYRTYETLTTGTIRIRGVNTSNCATCEPTLVADTVVFDAGHTTAIASTHSGGAYYDDRLLVAWSKYVGSNADVAVHALKNNTGGGTVVNNGGGCGQGGTLTFSPGPAIGTNWFIFGIVGLPVDSAVSVFNLSVPGSPTLACGPCVSNPFQNTSVVLTQTSDGITAEASTVSTIPCVLGLVGVTFDVQWTSLTPSASPCSLFPGLSVSDSYRLTIGQ